MRMTAANVSWILRQVDFQTPEPAAPAGDADDIIRETAK